MCFTENFWRLTVDGLSNGFLYALIALGYTLVYGVLQLINFAHSEVFMMGGFAGMFMLRGIVGPTPNIDDYASTYPFILLAAFAAASAAGGATAWTLERVAYRPLRR